ncbi:unnamed protein product [Blepharisma stoltei]|uniref:CKK domain-containing protein n=1 Tax=Blepharisma stoltei TaxID=1481888 RepID=A0AAU9JS72_9CILI|nr:unnamed protein product [Blepharisma stoltei]
MNIEELEGYMNKIIEIQNKRENESHKKRKNIRMQLLKHVKSAQDISIIQNNSQEITKIGKKKFSRYIEEPTESSEFSQILNVYNENHEAKVNSYTLSQADEPMSPSKKNHGGNSHVIKSILSSICLPGESNTSKREELWQKIEEVSWTNWFIVVFKETNENGFAVYGRKPGVLNLIAGGLNMPKKIPIKRIETSYVYDLSMRKFKWSKYCWDVDAVVI